MKRNKLKANKSKILIGLLLFLLIFVSGCNGKEEEIIEITMIHGWGSSESDHEAMRQIYMDFEKTHPEIKLNMISMPSNVDVIDKMGDLLTIGQIPDLVFTAGDGRESIYSFMVENDYAVNILPYIQSDEEFKRNINPAILSYWMKDDTLYTVSDVLLMGGYWYNQDLFTMAEIQKTPKTWEDWYEACEKLDILSEHRYPLEEPLILDKEHIIYLTDAILCEENSMALDLIRKNLINVQSPGIQATLKQLKEISKYSEVVNTYSYRDALDCFNKGEVAIYINGVWASSMISPELNVGYAAFPSKNGEGVSMVSSCVGYIVGNTGDEKRIQASIEFLKYMLSEEVAERIMKETGQIPSNPNVEIQVENERLFQAVNCVKEAGIMTEMPANLWNSALKEIYGDNVILYLQDKITLEELQNKVTDD